MKLDFHDSGNVHCVPVCYHTVQSGRWLQTLQRELFVIIRAEVLHRYLLLLLLSVWLPVANAPDVLQPCGLLYYP